MLQAIQGTEVDSRSGSGKCCCCHRESPQRSHSCTACSQARGTERCSSCQLQSRHPIASVWPSVHVCRSESCTIGHTTLSSMMWWWTAPDSYSALLPAPAALVKPTMAEPMRPAEVRRTMLTAVERELQSQEECQGKDEESRKVTSTYASEATSSIIYTSPASPLSLPKEAGRLLPSQPLGEHGQQDMSMLAAGPRCMLLKPPL